MAKRARISNPKLPSLPGIRQPPGFGIHDVTLRARGFSGSKNWTNQEPAGDPPGDFPGTRPEWAVYWALNQLGYEEGVDFEFTKMVGSISGVSPWSQIDFVLPFYGIGIEVQGEFWHNSQGSSKQEQDIYRAANARSQGLYLIFIDENDAQADPIYYTKEALAGIDHSQSFN